MMHLARDRERQKGDGPRPLDGERDLALVTRAVARDAPGHDFAAIADEVLQRLRVLVVDGDVLVRAELANALARAAPPARRVGIEVRRPAEVLVVAEIDVALAHGSFLLDTTAVRCGNGRGGLGLGLGGEP